MRAPGRFLAAIAALVTIVSSGCAGQRIEHGLFHSEKGYRLVLPEGDWIVVRGSDADLEIRRRSEPVGILVNAACGAEGSRASLSVLARHVLFGLRDRSTTTAERVQLSGLPAWHSVVDGHLDATGGTMRLEHYVARNDRCVYDFLYAAPPESFERWRSDFGRLVSTFASE